MKTILASTLVVMTAGLLSLGAGAGTPNTTVAGSVSYEVGQGWVSSYVDETAQNRWFAYKEFAGRSYCVDAAMGSGTVFPLDPNLTVYTDATGVTAFLTSTDSTIEPPRNKGATVCYASALAAGSLVRAFKVNVPVVTGSGDNGLVRTQVIESSLFGELFSYTTDANAVASIVTTVHLYNHSKATVNAKLYLPAYGTLGPYAVPAESHFKVTPTLSSAASYSYVNPAYITHDGYAGALSGSFDNKYPANGNTAAYTINYELMQR